MTATAGVTIGFSTTNKLLSRMIRFVTRSPCSHAWIAYWDETLQSRMVMQAEAWGFEVRPWIRWERQNTLVAEFQPGRPLDIVKLATLLGTRYDYRAAFLVGLARLFGRAVKGIYKDPVKLMCSEAVVRTLQWAHYRCAADLDPETTSPGALLACCMRGAERGELALLRALPAVKKQHLLET